MLGKYIFQKNKIPSENSSENDQKNPSLLFIQIRTHNPSQNIWIFLCFAIVSIHHKWNGTIMKLLSPQTECTKWENLRKISKMSRHSLEQSVHSKKKENWQYCKKIQQNQLLNIKSPTLLVFIAWSHHILWRIAVLTVCL